MVGRSVKRFTIEDPHLLQGITAQGLVDRALGSRVTQVNRRGKWVVIELGDDRGIIVIQPRMTGGFWLVSPDRPEHTRLTFGMGDEGKPIWFCDTRRLGKIAWFVGIDDAEAAFARSHGPDALNITEIELRDRLIKTSRGIKPTLMDQKVLAGIGNIYADEVLFHSRIHPERPSSGLTKPEIKRLHVAIGLILNEAIAAEGSSFDAGYRTVLGLEGGFLAKNAMYGRGGQPCPGCSGPITKTKIAGLIGRPTHYCPRCQVLRPSKGGRDSRR
ncbi:Fpg/Nei family DNA glycosylase [Tundrisphaera lichenicola]|uniref:Fpg/Nei family DNA glycosylase n=1 Tax=Tundrisphaera lichenicola TaxID=2029860 RepID=UPI003EB6F69C